MDSKNALMGIIKIATILTAVGAGVLAVLCLVYGKDAEQKIMGALCCLGVAGGSGWWIYRDWKKK